jgi:CRISPR-associated protein (TIGR03986 family)
MPEEFHNPYHFVPVEKPSDKKHRLSVEMFKKRELGDYSHAAYHQGKYSGRIICHLQAETPMFVGAEQHRENEHQPAIANHFELETGHPAIPASTLRGMLSAVVETASNSALRVLTDQVLSYRQEMRKSLSAIGMVVENEQSETTYRLIPLSMPTLKEYPDLKGFKFFSNLDSPPERNKEVQAYEKMFPEPRLKVYVGNYNNQNELEPNSLKQRETFSVGSNPVGLTVSKHEFEKKPFILRDNGFLHIKTIAGRGSETRYVIGQKRVKQSPIAENTRGIFRILGRNERDDMPNTKKHELLIPYPAEVKNWETFPILPEAIERFNQLADERTTLMAEKAEREGIDLDAMSPEKREAWLLSLVPYHLKGTQRNNDRSQFGNKLRIKPGDLVYFRPTLQNGNAVVTEVAFSSIWRGRVEDEQHHKASVHQFFAQIDKELLPFNQAPETKRDKISPAELLFGFVEQREETETHQKAGLAFAGRVQVSFGQLQPEQTGPFYEPRPVPLKILATPKLPCPVMYFRNRYNSSAYIKKADLKLEDHQPQGRKMYLHHRYNRQSAPPWKTANEHENANQKIKIKPVKEDTQFLFHIDFNNLDDWELGLLFYALRPTEEFRHKLGMGKSIGLGTVQIDPVGLFLIDRKQRYTEDNIFATSRYHQVWLADGFKPPKALYPDESQTQSTTKLPFTWQQTRDEFKNTMFKKIQQALELLGNPDKVTHPVHTPQVARRTSEEETFKWFVKNDEKRQQTYLKPLDEAGQKLPTLPRW